MVLTGIKAPVAIAERLGNSVEALPLDHAEAIEEHHEVVAESAPSLIEASERLWRRAPIPCSRSSAGW